MTFKLSLSHLKKSILLTISSSICLVYFSQAQAPDLMLPGAVDLVKASAHPNQGRSYEETYNLGATGLRGWFYMDNDNAGYDGNITSKSRQILVTAVGPNTPAAVALLQEDDVILGATADLSAVALPVFGLDARRTLGLAIGEAEKTANNGKLKLKIWRKGVLEPFGATLQLKTLGSYSSTTPYNCEKSTNILIAARKEMIRRLTNRPNYISERSDYSAGVCATSLLAGFAPGVEGNGLVQQRLREYAESITGPGESVVGSDDMWKLAYVNIFLSEYYMRLVEDGVTDQSFLTRILSGVQDYTITLAKAQSLYGTYGHGGAQLRPNGELHGAISWYGPINSVAIPANISIVLGKKAINLAGAALNSEIDPAIVRGTNFYRYYVNKGSIPYGEHEPWMNGHCSNGKDQMCAVFYGLQNSLTVETEYYTRMSLAGIYGTEYGHNGPVFSTLWGAMGVNMAGQEAVGKYMENLNWLFDLKRRTDGSFIYEGQDEYGAGNTVDGSYFGDFTDVNFSDLDPTAYSFLTYALPLKRLCITGKNVYSTNTLDTTKIAHAVASANHKRLTSTFTTTELLAKLSDFDPITRFDSANKLISKSLTNAQRDKLIADITEVSLSNSANLRMSACQVLGGRRVTSAIPALTQRLTDPDQWVRANAATALKRFGDQADPQRIKMLEAFISNSLDSDTVDWIDPIHISNTYLANTIFSTSPEARANLILLNKTLTFEALSKGLREPSNSGRAALADFVGELSLDDVKTLAPALVKAASQLAPGNRMEDGAIRNAVCQTFANYKIEEGIPLCLMLREQNWHTEATDPLTYLRQYGGAAKEALPTLQKWFDHLPIFERDSSANACCPGRFDTITNDITSTIAAIQSDTSPPPLVYFKSLALTAAPAVAGLTSTSITLNAAMTDLDGGENNVIWTAVGNPPGPVVFDSPGLSSNPRVKASFSVPGTYVLRARSVDRSILNKNIWSTNKLGYFDFNTYDQIVGSVAKEITVTVEAPELSGIPVSKGLVLRMDASQVSEVEDGSQLNKWYDTSGAGNHAARQSASSTNYPKYIANGLNGLPVVRFNSASPDKGDSFRFTRIPTIRTVFWVLKENPGLADNHFLLGDSDNYHFHRGSSPNGPLWDGQFTSAEIRNGTTKLMGNVVNGVTTSLPSGSFQLVSLVTTGNVSANQICQDRTSHGSWQGDIAEVLIYDRPLTSDEEAKVGTYLSDKYGLTTSYKALPVSSGLVLRMDASQISGTPDGAQLNTWTDTSGAANNAARQSASSNGFPKFVANGINGLPVVRFNSGDPAAGDYLKFNRISNIRSVFWVLKENAGLLDSHFLLGDDTSYDFHRKSNNGPLWDQSYTADKIQNGITKLMGNTINGTSTSLPAESFQLVSLVTTGDVRANQICQDRTSHGSWQGDIAEILIYNRALTGTEQARVGAYLAKKYQLTTSYPSSPISSIPAAVAAVPGAAGKVRVTWNAVPGAIGYKVWSRNTQNGAEQVITSNTSPCEVTGLIAGTRYEFKVSSIYPRDVIGNYSSLVSATPNQSSGYASWASNPIHGLTAGLNNQPMDDPDRDGVCNLMEFALGGAPMASSQAILPVLSNVSGSWVFEYSRSDLSRDTTTQIVEHTTDLVQWAQITVPASTSVGDGVSITAGRVKVIIPSVSGKPKFVRLKMSQ